MTTIKPWLQNVYGFEGHLNSQSFEAKSLSLEKIATFIKLYEEGISVPKVNLVHYTTKRIIKKKKKKKVITKHNYDLAFYSFGQNNFDGGHHRTMASFLGKYELNSEIIEDDSFIFDFYSTIPEKNKENIFNLNIESRYDRVRDKNSLPVELQNPKKIPTKREIYEFFNSRKNQKITYKEIIENLYQ